MDKYWSDKPKFLNWNREDYIKNNVLYTVPMTAKEVDESKQEELLNSPNYFVEEKLDGTRGTIHFYSDYARVFSRRESKKSGWLTENTDSVPQLRDIHIPELNGTILDGEMYIPDVPFNDISGILNCTYDTAIERQQEKGFLCLNVFDILYYKGIKIEKMPLYKRKSFLDRIIRKINNFYEEEYPSGFPYIRRVPYFKNNTPVFVGDKDLKLLNATYSVYPNLFNKVKLYKNAGNESDFWVRLTPKEYYEWIVMHGGEGIMLKPIDGKYYHKRGREYQKIKKFLTRDVIIMGFTEPTEEYTGKFPDDSWGYWIDPKTNEKQDPNRCLATPAKELKKSFMPVTRYYFENWVGNIRYGVIITEEEFVKLSKSKKFTTQKMKLSDGKEYKVVEVGDCGGFDDEMRKYFTDNRDSMIGKVIEVKANEQYKDTGKLRHPRFLRMRDDKDNLACTWTDHFG